VRLGCGQAVTSWGGTPGVPGIAGPGSGIGVGSVDGGSMLGAGPGSGVGAGGTGSVVGGGASGEAGCGVGWLGTSRIGVGMVQGYPRGAALTQRFVGMVTGAPQPYEAATATRARCMTFGPRRTPAQRRCPAGGAQRARTRR
jgi:hypothetical protein